MYQVYGIKNCDTVKKALTWLNEKDIDFEFHDYKSKGVSVEKLKSWIDQIGWEALVNRKGMTWRQLDDDVKATVKNASSAIKLMAAKTSVIKRPLIERNGKVITVGFDENEYSIRIKP